MISYLLLICELIDVGYVCTCKNGKLRFHSNVSIAKPGVNTDLVLSTWIG